MIHIGPIARRCLIPALLLTLPFLADAQRAAPGDSLEIPAWAFPGRSPGLHPAVQQRDGGALLHLPGSVRSFTDAEVRDPLHPPDWHPRSHPPAPASVINARPEVRYACGYCHLPDGGGRSENAALAGLSSRYIVRQVEAFRAGTRQGARPGDPVAHMIEVSRLASRTEVASAARYFARVRLRPRFAVVERSRVPAMYEAGGLYAARPGADSEPIAGRLLEMTESLERHELRDPDERFTTFVPPGALALGQRLATRASDGEASNFACARCHGAALRGASAPPLAGRSPAYLLRQLLAFRSRARSGPDALVMQAAVAPLSLSDMVAVAAYAGSLAP